MKKNFLSLFIALLIVLPVPFYGQSVENNFQQRYSTSIEYKASKKFSFVLSPEIRTKNNAISIDEYLMEGAVGYELIDWFEVGGRYRLRNKSSKTLQRIAIEASVKRSLGRFAPSLRLMLTNENEIGSNAPSEKLWRTRFKLKYKRLTRILNPYSSIEAFRNLDENEWQKMRYLIGAQFRLNKYFQLDLQYKFDYFLSKFQNDHIIGLNLKIKL
ncbi:MAG: DUF2490 domain-containing protein [Methanobacteriota archaeon]|nr:MAG: DUF2490 domain-containing protein [Euryarchaeota archaeon]